MSTRHLDALLDPASVVLVGASPREDSLGGVVWRNVRAGTFKGAVYALNLKGHRLDGQRVYRSVSELPGRADLAVICTGAASVPQLIDQLGSAGTRAAIVLTDAMPAAQRQAMLDAAHAHSLRVLGPASIGVLSPHIGLNASVVQADAAVGELALLSQSGSIAAAMVDWARARQIGFSHVVSLGDHADVDAGDLLDYLGSDPRTRAILLCIDVITAPRKFLSAARGAARNKPVILVRWPPHRASAEDEQVSDRVYDAAVARAGMLRVESLQDMLLAAESLVRFRASRSDHLLIVGNGRGAIALAAQAAARVDVQLAAPSAATLQALLRLGVLADAAVDDASPHAPSDAPSDAPSEALSDAPSQAPQPTLSGAAPTTAAPLLLRADVGTAPLAQAMQLLAEDAAAPALLLIHSPTAKAPSASLARALLPMARLSPPRLIGCWLGHAAAAEPRLEFQRAGIPSYETPEEAVKAFSGQVAYRRNQAQLIEAPPQSGGDVDADAAAARALVQRALSAGRTVLDVGETHALLALYGIALRVAQRVEAEPYAAASAAEKIGYPVLLQVLASGIAPGLDGGGMTLDLRSGVQVRDAAQRMLAALRRQRPAARVEGFSVEPMKRPAAARVLRAGARIDPLFGPVIWLAGDGRADDAHGQTFALPPLNAPLARALMHRSGVSTMLRAHAQAVAADATALQRVLVGLSQLLIDVSQVAEVSLSPLWVGSDGALVLQARVRLSVHAPAGALNFAIRPYPSQLVDTLHWQGRTLTLRPIRPEDEAQHMAFLNQIEPVDVRMRLFYSRRSIARSELARLTQIDYAREMAFIAVETGPDGAERTLAVVRAVADANNAEAEFGILIRSDMKGHKLGPLLMHRIIDYQRSRGTGKLVATVLAENTRMLALATKLGFVEKRSDEPGVRAIELVL